MNTSSNDLPLRPNVCMLVHNASFQLFLGERLGEPGVWQFPQGGAVKRLSLEENVIKELNEELGADKELFKIVTKLEATHAYRWEQPPKYAIGKWSGQSQTFWVVKFLGEDCDIELDRYDPELSDWRWCTPDEVRSLADPKRLPGYLKPLEEFEKIVAGAGSD